MLHHSSHRQGRVDTPQARTVIPRLSPRVSMIAAVAAVLVVPYYLLHGQEWSALGMMCLGAMNAMCARHA